MTARLTPDPVDLRRQLVQDYWFDGLTIKAIGKKYAVNHQRISRLFSELGILTRATGGRGHRGRPSKKNRERLGLMLLPFVDEWRGTL